MLIRDVCETDVARIAEIYGDAVANGRASFEIEPPNVTEMTSRIAEITTAGCSWLVAEVNDVVAGYAYFGSYHGRPAYRWTVENSVYVDDAFRGRGIGAALLETIVTRAQSAGFRQILAIIGDAANEASIRLHASADFAHAGYLRNVGFKHGRWLDCVIMQRALGPGSSSLPERAPLRP